MNLQEIYWPITGRSLQKALFKLWQEEMLPFNQAFHMNILCLLCMEINISGGRHLQRAVVIPLLHSLRFQRGRAGAGARLLMAQGKATSPIHHQFITIPKKNLNFKLS